MISGEWSTRIECLVPTAIFPCSLVPRARVALQPESSLCMRSGSQVASPACFILPFDRVTAQTDLPHSLNSHVLHIMTASATLPPFHKAPLDKTPSVMDAPSHHSPDDMKPGFNPAAEVDVDRDVEKFEKASFDFAGTGSMDPKQRKLTTRIIHSFHRAEYQNKPARDAESELPQAGDTSHLHRKLKGRHLQMISIGGAIGAGLFIGSGRALATGGPGAVLLDFGLIGAMLFCTVNALGELATLFPVQGNHHRTIHV